jgi:hypothetical protein
MFVRVPLWIFHAGLSLDDKKEIILDLREEDK